MMTQEKRKHGVRFTFAGFALLFPLSAGVSSAAEKDAKPEDVKVDQSCKSERPDIQAVAPKAIAAAINMVRGCLLGNDRGKPLNVELGNRILATIASKKLAVTCHDKERCPLLEDFKSWDASGCERKIKNAVAAQAKLKKRKKTKKKATAAAACTMLDLAAEKQSWESEKNKTKFSAENMRAHNHFETSPIVAVHPWKFANRSESSAVAALGPVLFHELIHAADPAYALVNSMAIHNQDGFPDVVYGCYFACMGTTGAAARGETALASAAEVLKSLPAPLDDYRCDQGLYGDNRSIGDAACTVLKRYARLCSQGVPQELKTSAPSSAGAKCDPVCQ
jgi:hypothetical protein